MTTALQPWARLRFPADLTMLPLAQAAARELSAQYGLDSKRRLRIELAVEEVMNTLLRYAFDEQERGELEMEIGAAAPMLRLVVRSLGLPFDLSMVPDFDPGADAETLDAALQAGSLSAFLLKQVVDRYRLVNDGKLGCRFELEWFLPGPHITEFDPPVPAGNATPGQAPEPVACIRRLHEDEAIGLARLVYRGYGYSYVYEDIYYPDRIRARQREGILSCWGAVTASGRLVGHLALMKQRAEAEAVEWGIAVVDPDWRGSSVMKRLLAAAIQDVQARGETILYAHAVTAHPYTLKTAERHGFQPVALLLAYAPASLNYRHIDERQAQRGSTFLTLRCMKPCALPALHIPARHAGALQCLLTALGLSAPLHAGPGMAPQSACTHFSTSISASVNVAQVDVDVIGADGAPALARELRRLCRERVDVINLTVDLADPAAPWLVEAAESCGFFMAGLTPMLPRPASLTLQFLNNIRVDFADIHTAGPLSLWVRDWVAAEQQRIEEGLGLSHA